MDWDDAHRACEKEISRLSRTQRVPGLEPEDVANEMLSVLWKAATTYQPDRGAFGVYWWSSWLNRRNDLLSAFSARKRPPVVPVANVPEVPGPEYHPFPMPPEGTGILAQEVWGAIAYGETTTQIRRDLELSKRRYYSIIKSWHTDEVRRDLKGQW